MLLPEYVKAAQIENVRGFSEFPAVTV